MILLVPEQYVFISYSHKDKEYARKLAAELEEHQSASHLPDRCIPFRRNQFNDKVILSTQVRRTL